MVNEDENLTISQIYKKLKELIEKETASIKLELINTNKNLLKNLDEANDKIQALEKENKNLHKLIEENIRASKKNDIIIFGLEEQEGEDVFLKVIHFLQTYLNTKVSKSEINHIYKFGKTGTIRQTVVKFVCLHKKIEVLKQGKLLKNTPYAISNNLSKRDREIQKELRTHLKEIKIKNPEAKIKNNQIVIGQSAFNLEQLKTQQEIREETEKEEGEKQPRFNEKSETSHPQKKEPAKNTRSKSRTGHSATKQETYKK